jgi:DNA (cytosine-5)-methyltransferase 1
VSQLVLSLFPGIGLLDRAFEEEGFTVVRGPDLLWGGDVQRFHPLAGKFDGVIGGPPCQAWSTLVPIIRACGKRVAEDLIPEYERVVGEAQPEWFVMENVSRAPTPRIAGYCVDPTLLNNRWLGERQSRLHRFSFGTRAGLKLHYQLAALEDPSFAYRVTTDARQQPVRLLAGGHPKRPKLRHRLNHEGPVLSIEEMCELQGLPADFFAHSPFTRTAQRRMLGNAVPLPMGRALARAVKAALRETAA